MKTITPTRNSSLLAACLALVLSVIASFVVFISPTHAANAKDFNPGHIIDDAVFYNSGAMDATKIQKFLESKNPNCDYNGTQSAADWGYPNITHAKLAEYKRNGTNGFSKDTGFHAPPYKCLTKYTQSTPQMEAASGYCSAISAGSRTAAKIINDVAKACGINPQVLIVLLEKEQSLVTDNWPLNRQLRNATGFACPDTAPCNPAYEGFFYQVYYAARQFKVYKANPNSYNYRAGRNNNIYWHPDLSRCGSSTVYIQNQATAALYIYTPYRPNSAALSNLYGTGNSCSSYGNRNFWRIFTDWFGSTLYKIGGGINTKYNSLGGASVVGMPTSNEIKTTTGGVYQLFDNGRIYWKNGVGAWYIHGGIGNKYIAIGADKSSLRYPNGDEVTLASGVTYQSYENGRIYWKSGNPTVFILSPINTKYQSTGLDTGSLGYPTTDTLSAANNGNYQIFTKGRIYWSASTGAHTLVNKMLTAYGALNYDKSYLGLPTTDEVSITGGAVQAFQSGQIYVLGSNTYTIHGGINTLYKSLGSSSGSMGLPMSNEVPVSGGVYQQFENGRIYWSSKTGAVSTYGKAYDKYLEIGAQTSILGVPTKNPTSSYQQFENGRIYFNGSTAYTLHGGIYTKYLQSASFLGNPSAGETTISGGVYQQFENGRIYWSSKSGAVKVSGGIGNKYLEFGASTGYLGMPVSAEKAISGGVYQQFENGRIYWSSRYGAVKINGGIGSKYIGLGAEKSRLGLPKSEEVKTSENTYQLFAGGKIVWSSNRTTVLYN